MGILEASPHNRLEQGLRRIHQRRRITAKPGHGQGCERDQPVDRDTFEAKSLGADHQLWPRLSTDMDSAWNASPLSAGQYVVAGPRRLLFECPELELLARKGQEHEALQLVQLGSEPAGIEIADHDRSGIVASALTRRLRYIRATPSRQHPLPLRRNDRRHRASSCLRGGPGGGDARRSDGSETEPALRTPCHVFKSTSPGGRGISREHRN